MPTLIAKVRQSLERDKALPLSMRLSKGWRYVVASALAPLYLRDCDSVGARPRAVGRPRVDNRGRIDIGPDVNLNSTFAPCELATGPGGRIEIGKDVGINFGTLIAAANCVTIGDGVDIGPYSIIADHDRADGVSGRDSGQPIEIGAGAWLAGRVTVLPGSSIGAGSVITAGSIVSGVIPPGVVAGGIPARVLRPADAPPDEVDRQAGIDARRETSGPSTDVVAPPAEVRRSTPRMAGPLLRGVVLSDFVAGDLATRLADPSDPPAMEVTETPFGQVIQSLATFPPNEATDFAVVWTRPEGVSPSFQRVLRHEGASDDTLRGEVDDFCDRVVSAARHYRFTFVPTWTLDPSQRGLGMADARPGGVAWALAVMNQRLMERLGAERSVFVLNAQPWLSAAGRASASARAWYFGKVAFSPAAVTEAARDIKAAVRGLLGQTRKLLVLDLDETVWGGVVGDDGWENLRLGGHDPEGEALVDFQRGVKALTRRGVVLGIASKNTESVALEAMRCHPEMVLKPEDFVGWRINWQDKAGNIADLAAELNLGLDSVVFIDDNPEERDRVREALPDVLVPEWPNDKLLFPAALAALRCFDAPAVSREDAERTELYASERRRGAMRAEVGSVEEWLAGLDIRVRAERVGPSMIARTAQLLNKTNQMNLSTRRLTEQQLAAWAEGLGRELWAVSVSDRVGDAGLTGILGIERDGSVLRIVDFILSCRVMGRKVEETMAALAVERARVMGASSVDAQFIRTKKNQPCYEFWTRSGFAVEPATDRFAWDASREYPRPPYVTLTVAGDV